MALAVLGKKEKEKLKTKKSGVSFANLICVLCLRFRDHPYLKTNGAVSSQQCPAGRVMNRADLWLEGK